jgi:hypothetical protein
MREEYFIFRVDAREEAQDRPFEQVSKQAELEYAKILRDKMLNEAIRETFAEEKVVINEGQIK